jgi:pSer/pThr/pTyr-binding forkhead associated (FHA) protein
MGPGLTRGTHLPEIVILNGSRAGAVFALSDVPTVLGRSPEAHIRVEDPWISSMHALFERRGGDVWVIDLESRNGTFLGDDRVTEACLPPGTVLRFGRTEVRLQDGVAPGAAALAPAVAEAPSEAEPPRPDSHRATIRADATAGTGIPRFHAAEDTDPADVVVRPAAVLRITLHARGGATPDAASIRAALDAASRAALNEGGLAVRLAGAGVLAVFGLPGSAADDALRAVRAARTARDAVRDLAAGLEVRAGVERGPLLTGNLAGPDAFELTALGDTAERAERLVAMAAPGEILAGPGAAGALHLRGGSVVAFGSEELEVFRDAG